MITAAEDVRRESARSSGSTGVGTQEGRNGTCFSYGVASAETANGQVLVLVEEQVNCCSGTHSSTTQGGSSRTQDRTRSEERWELVALEELIFYCSTYLDPPQPASLPFSFPTSISRLYISIKKKSTKYAYVHAITTNPFECKEGRREWCNWGAGGKKIRKRR